MILVELSKLFTGLKMSADLPFWHYEVTNTIITLIILNHGLKLDSDNKLNAGSTWDVTFSKCCVWSWRTEKHHYFLKDHISLKWSKYSVHMLPHTAASTSANNRVWIKHGQKMSTFNVPLKKMTQFCDSGTYKWLDAFSALFWANLHQNIKNREGDLHMMH